MAKILVPVTVAICSLVIVPLLGQKPDPRPAKSIQDNSFLIEEAYNQEAGVVQHILNVRRSFNHLPGSDERAWAANRPTEPAAQV